MQQIEIKLYDGSYDQEIVEHILAIQRDEFGILVTRDDQPDICAINDFYMQGKGAFLLADCDGKIVGTLGLLDIGSSQLALRKMFVHKSFRGQPHFVAQNLLEKAFLWSREHDVKQIFLGTTVMFLAAHRFYEKNGFYRVEGIELPEAFPIMKVDTIFYKYDL